MEYAEELKELQKVLLDILKEVKRVCDENNIDYFIIAGTALGAVRHKGFIPWDDDIDIGMTRDNYEKFIKIANTKLSEEFFLQTMETEEETPFYFAKVRKNKTKFICPRKITQYLNNQYGDFMKLPKKEDRKGHRPYILEL